LGGGGGIALTAVTHSTTTKKFKLYHNALIKCTVHFYAYSLCTVDVKLKTKI
jgi:hypothetical protein